MIKYYVTAYYQRIKDSNRQMCIISAVFKEDKAKLRKAKKQKDFCLETYLGEKLVKHLKEENDEYQYGNMNIVYLKKVN